MPTLTPLADGSAAADAHSRVEIDLSDFLDRARYLCPNGHMSWEPTNSHLWCSTCSRAAQQGAAVDAEHYSVYDQRKDETIPFAAVDIVE